MDQILLYNTKKNSCFFNENKSSKGKEEDNPLYSHSKFSWVDDKPNFPAMEEKVIQFWRKINAFKTQLEKSKGKPAYTFYDGPPFATGMPHYGHLIAGGLKDAVTRYWTQRGRYCIRRFGWDCHGLPIECIINEQMGIKTKKDLDAIGIEKYNSECRKIIMKYAEDWKYYTERSGRWIDFENDYRTMYPTFMESVWWVFKQIFNKGRVYRKCKIMPYSCKTNTVLSNFEAGLEYNEHTKDPSVIITFPIVGEENKALLAWTTTPWTLPSNMFLTVNNDLVYVEIELTLKGKKMLYILAEARIKETLKQLNVKDDNYKILKKMKGKDLIGIEYVPLFKYFYEEFKKKGNFKVYEADYVSAEDGTGIVHNAPGFGEEDYKAGCRYKLCDPDKPPCPMDADGCFTDEVQDYKGIYFKDADKLIMERLTKEGRMIFKGTIEHSYPMCYRTHTPLMYRAIPSWFVRVEDLQERLVEINKESNWVPKYVQDKRFGNWLANAKDWCISRSRCWGTPIPLWVNDDFSEIVAIGSIEELEKLSGVKGINDLHREYIDKIEIPSKDGKSKLHRIPEVFDCWFESGSMPYAQVHYPFEVSQKDFEKIFPADFIAEGIDQTRGWFYTLVVISTILFNKSPYKNLIVNGLVLDEIGRKLSKHLKNYKDPKILFDTYGSDPLRLYLIDSGLVKAQPLKFSEEKGLKQKIKDVFLPLYNSYRFLIQNIQRYEASSGKNFTYNKNILYSNKLNILDRWIIGYEQRLLKFLHKEMENYRLYTVVHELLGFLDKFTNWYIRLNRSRIKGDFGDEERLISLNVLYSTTLYLIILLSPFIPLITEAIYQNLKNGLEAKDSLLEESIHFLNIPDAEEKLLSSEIEETVSNMITVIELGRKLRELKKLNLKRPVAKLYVINGSKSFLESLKAVENYIVEELNANEIEYISEEAKYMVLSAKANFQILFNKTKEIKDSALSTGKENDPETKKEEKEAKEEANKIAESIKNFTQEDIRKLLVSPEIKKNGITIPKELVIIERKFLPEYLKPSKISSLANENCGIRIDTESSEEIVKSYYMREICNKIQRFRREVGISLTDTIIISYTPDCISEKLLNVVNEKKDEIEKRIKVPLLTSVPSDYYEYRKNKYVIDENEEIEILIFKKN